MTTGDEDADAAAFGAFLESPAYQRALEEAQASLARDATVIEEAPWFGQTGLDEDSERELSRYLRREFGERLEEPGALKAADLTYRGAFREEVGVVHYWEIPSHEPGTFAYVVDSEDGGLMGWSDRAPPTYVPGTDPSQ